MSLDLGQLKALAAALDMPPSTRALFKKHRWRYARFQAEQDKIAAGTHQRIDDERPFRRKLNKFGKPSGKTLPLNDHVWRIPKAQRPACGAQTRKGTPCAMKAIPGRARCRLHGGLSTGPKTQAGREAIRESNRRRAKSTPIH